MKVELLTHFGNDKMVCDVARVSYGKIKETFDDKDIKLIHFLAENEHTSPFRHPHLQFRVQCSIFVERQIFKHSVGISTNSISGRYVDFSDSYDLPDQLRYQSKSSKQGSAGNVEPEKNAVLVDKMKTVIELAAKTYAELEEAGVAKEQCRAILPLCLETTFVWTGSFQAFAHLCHLRLKSDVQKETQEVVAKMLDLVKKIPNAPFQHSINAFGL